MLTGERSRPFFTIHVHVREVIAELFVPSKAKNISDPRDFEWLKQVRFYWSSTGSDNVSVDGASTISITDVDFNFQYEYLGAKERLVVTPLTDRRHSPPVPPKLVRRRP